MNGCTCPHCGRSFYSGGFLSLHAPVCPRSPEQRAAVAAALADPDRPGWARGQHAYAAAAAATGAPSHTALREAFGSWAAVCDAFGLEPAPGGRPRGNGERPERSRLREARAIAEVEEALEADARLREALRDRGWTVCSAPRVLADGRLAWVLR